MSRRPRRQPQDRFQQVLELLNQVIALPPTRSIGEELKAGLIHVQRAVTLGQTERENLSGLTAQIELVVAQLPQSYRDRFFFDSAMIGIIALQWNEGRQRLSSTIFPRYGTEWSHGRIQMPTRSRNTNDSFLSFITLPGTDDLASVDLLDYAFMFHELAHNLLFFDDIAFKKDFSTQLDRVTGHLSLAGIADRGSARIKGQRRVEAIRCVWTPTDDHENWANEMMMDIIAVWACGPAYLLSFEFEMSDETKNPYQVDQAHPPYALRTEALLWASRELGWTKYSSGLEVVIEKWRASYWKSRIDNDYVALADSKIMQACITSTLVACAEVGLPLCDEQHIKRVESVLASGNTPDFGVDIVLAAWLKRRRTDEAAYQLWEREIVDALNKRIADQAAATNVEAS